MKRIAFVCTGNTCRSPMAENILREKLKQQGINEYTISSFGIFVVNSVDMHPYAKEALKSINIDITKHTPRQATPILLKDFDLIIALTKNHIVQLKFPTNAVTLDALTSIGDIDDPYGGTMEDYLACAKQLESAIEMLIPVLAEVIIKIKDTDKSELN